MMNWRKSLYSLIVPKENRDSVSIMYWREKIFNSILLVCNVIGILVLIPSIVTCLTEKLYFQIIVDLMIFVSIATLFFSSRIPYRIKPAIFLSLLYLLGLSIIIARGPHGTGYFYLLAYSVLASAWLELKAGIITIILNSLTVVTIAFLSYYNILEIKSYAGYSSAKWSTLIANFFAINLIVTISISLLIVVV